MRVTIFRRAGSNLRAKRGQISTRVARHIRVYLFMSGLSNFKAQTLTAPDFAGCSEYTYSLKYLSLSEVTVLIFLAPLYDGDPWSCHLGREDWRWARTCRV